MDGRIKKDGKHILKTVNYRAFSETPLEFLTNRISLQKYVRTLH